LKMETDAQYESRSLGEAMRHLEEVKRAPLSDRKEAQAEFLEAMRESPDIIAERLGWLFDGNYGRGEMLKARQIINMGRGANKKASLNQLIAALEWQCPADMAVAAWKKLSSAEKEKLDQAIEIVIEAAEKEKREEGW